MKTYEEMAQSVMDRAKAHKTARNRWIAGSVAAVCALGIGLGTLAMKPHTSTQQPVPMTEAPIRVVEAPKAEAKVTFLYAEGDNATEMKQGVTVPCRSQLRIVDVSGKTDDEIEAIALSEQTAADALVADYPEAQGGWIQYCASQSEPSRSNDHLVATFVHAGHFVLNVQDWSLVESIEASTKNSVLILPGFPRSVEHDAFAYPQPRHYHMNKEEMAQRYYNGGIGASIGLGSGVVWYLNENPIPLSQLSETFTFTFNFKDGTQETYTIDMLFNDNGEIYALYQGALAIA